MAQPAQLFFRQYNTNDGLPSSETYTLFEDRAGYMWVGTDNGIARFDGYEFEVFDADDGLEDVVVFAIQEDDRGVIWISTFSGRVYYYEDGTFHPFAHNDKLEAMKKSSSLLVLMDVLPNGHLLMRSRYKGLCRVNEAGEFFWISESPGHLLYFYEHPDRAPDFVHNHVFYHQKAKTSPEGGLRILSGREGDWKHAATLDMGNKGNITSINYAQIIQQRGRKEYLVVGPKVAWIIDEDGAVKHEIEVNSRSVNYILPGEAPNEYLIFFDRGLGVTRYRFTPGVREPEVDHLLAGQSLSSAIIDHRGGMWVSSRNAGIFYSPFPKQRVYSPETQKQPGKPISLCLTGPGSFYTGYDNGMVLSYDKDVRSFRNILGDDLYRKESIKNILYHKMSGMVMSFSVAFRHPVPAGRRLHTEDVVFFRRIEGVKSEIASFTSFPLEDVDKIYAASKSSLIVFEPKNDFRVTYRYHGSYRVANLHVGGTNSYGQIVIGTLHGLNRVENGEMVPDNMGIPELSERVVNIVGTPGKGRLYGTRGKGIVYHSADTSYVIREADGLVSDLVRHIQPADDNVYWVSTLTGVSKLTLSPDEKSYTLSNFTTTNGLPSNEVYYADTWGDEVWLASTIGIIKFVEPAVDSVSPPPVLRRALVNGRAEELAALAALPAGPQDVSINFGTINFVLGDQVNYRYRINAKASWQYTTNRTANYPNLPPGDYGFTVQSRNQDGFWSESTTLPIAIAAPWYTRWWALTGGILLLLGALTAYFLFRERRRVRERDLLLQINQLEHAALHAQMNPHFVFNALNSIQNFVLENDARQASTYLSRFARIIRQTLRSSVSGEQTLAEELDMLRTYLVLEKLRFKEGFNYEITVDDELPLDAVTLPPLLIQPFVENAIIHGLKEKQDGGRIRVHFGGTAEELEVTIEDNGRGYQRDPRGNRESMGMDITRRRLEMMNVNSAERSGMEVEVLYDERGKPSGTRVTLYIYLQSDKAFIAP